MKFERFISKPRLDRFLIGCGNDHDRALELYKANINISKSYYPILHLFEIFLRNIINSELINFFKDPDWIRTQKNGFMSDSSLAPSAYFLREEISRTETRLGRRGIIITPGKIISEQTLGFWTSLFEIHHYRLLQGSIIQCFPLKPSYINRRNISVRLNNIRDFRNRIFHNEPICFNGTSIDFNNAESNLNDMIDLLSWIDGELPGYVNYFNDIHKRISKAKRI